MESTALVNSLGIGGAIFAGLVLLWFLRKFIKRRTVANQANAISAPASQTSWEEKRKHPRVAVSWPAQIETSNGQINAQLKDISLGGAFVVCQNPLPLNQQFSLIIKAPNQDSLALNAEVVWSNINVPEDKIINRGMGVRFIRNTDADRQRLNQVIMAYLE
jgi:c-di-GMP-binding flagellar brake protein YcgR